MRGFNPSARALLLARCRPLALALGLALAAATAPAPPVQTQAQAQTQPQAQNTAPTDALPYKTPAPELTALVDAPLTPFVSFSPDHRWMLIMERPALPGIADLAEPELRIGGLRIRPRTNGPSRVNWPIDKLTLKSLDGAVTRDIAGLPPGADIQNVSWSPDGSTIAFTVTNDANIELWMAEVARVNTRRVMRQRLNAAMGHRPYSWLSDSRTLVCTIVPEERGPEPAASRVPLGPVVQENTGQKLPARTYQDLLENTHDEALFDYYLTAQVMRVNLDGDRERLGDPRVVSNLTPSPDGKELLVETLHRPYSYLVPWYRFPRRIEVWDLDGNKVKTLADVPLQEGVPIAFGSVPTGPRSVGWRDDAPATLVWAEAQDGGDAGAEADVRDKLFLLPAPFTGQPAVLATLAQRYGGVEWGTGALAMVHSWWWTTRNEKTWIVEPDHPRTAARLLFDRSWEDVYGDPGSFVTAPNAYGREVLLADTTGTRLYLVGDGASPEGKRPFLDRLDLGTLQAERLWRSEPPFYERPVDLLDREAAKVVTRRESRENPPNYFIRDLAAAAPAPGGGDTLQAPADSTVLTALTAFPDPYPQLRGVHKELIHYQRADGVKLTGTLYLPAGYKPEDGPLPTVMWAYPQEFKSADAAGQVTDSPYQFDRIGWYSPLVWLVRGYAVLDDPKLPIVGEGDTEPNDTYVPQLVAGAQAAVDAVVSRGVTDPDRIAIGGHSYGAFMAANLLAHSDLFRAGIARSGAYNRTLTPFGFQAEERTLWQAPDVYFAMSPFMHADTVNEPLLLIHGMADNNSGTFPMQSERFYNALKGLGATCRLVMLPFESHGYRARESVLHMLWETDRWLATYVKNAGPREPAPDAGAAGGSGKR